MKVTAKIYDHKTPFNDTPVSVINEAWDKQWGKNTPIALVYKDGEFTGEAAPLGNRSIEQAEAHYQAMFEQMEAAQQAAEHHTSTIEEINAKLDFMIMMEG